MVKKAVIAGLMCQELYRLDALRRTSSLTGFQPYLMGRAMWPEAPQQRDRAQVLREDFDLMGMLDESLEVIN